MISREILSALAKKGRIEIIRTLKAFPERDFTINELARTAKVPAMTVWRAVNELRHIGVVRTRKVGNATSVRIADDRELLRMLRIVPDTDPQRTAARSFAEALAEMNWISECRLFGNIGRGEHSPGDEVDVAIIYDDSAIQESEAKSVAAHMAERIKAETNVTIMPFCLAKREMSRKGGLAAELRDKEIIWKRDRDNLGAEKLTVP